MRRFLVLILLSAILMTGCGIRKDSKDKTRDLEYTLVDRGAIPAELVATIEKEKVKPFAMSANIEGYTYIVQGYGCQPTGGYSIRVDSVYETTESVYFHSTLVGPAAGEPVNKLATYPYLVIKIEGTEKNINFE